MKRIILTFTPLLALALSACSINVSDHHRSNNDLFECFSECEDDECVQACNEEFADLEHEGLIGDEDEDGDGYTNAEEEAAGSDPCDADSIPEDPQGDDDEDGLTNEQEDELGTDSDNPDSDEDGLNDGDEVDAGTDPNVADTDGDGYPDGDEGPRGTDPLNPDTDGDGVSDGDEVACHSSPIDAQLTCEDTLCEEAE